MSFKKTRGRKLSVSEDNKRLAVNRILLNFKMTDETLQTISDHMLADMHKGLGRETNDDAVIKMIPSFVTHLPDGNEEGQFLALDLGGTNFRVLLVTLKKGLKPEIDSQIFKMPKAAICGTAEDLFDYIAECMAEFLDRLDIYDCVIPVGFTFSFPCKQTSIDKSTLITWTKGFTSSGVVGKDVGKLLNDAINKRDDFKVTIIALVNDTVGTMMSCAYDNRNCTVGLIIGTGSNACYMEECKNIELIPEEEGRMCINMEWGAFGDDGSLDSIRSEFDHTVDETSLNKGKQLYEKMISGMYMGELVRLVLCKLTKDEIMFDGTGSDQLFTPHMFETSYVSKIERLASYGMSAIQDIFAHLDLGARKIDCEIMLEICRAVSTRSAYLCAAGIAAIARKIKANHPEKTDLLEVTVGVDGTVYKKHPTFAKLLQKKCNQLVEKENIKVSFFLSHDGSGKGAALITAVANNCICGSMKKKEEPPVF